MAGATGIGISYLVDGMPAGSTGQQLPVSTQIISAQVDEVAPDAIKSAYGATNNRTYIGWSGSDRAVPPDTVEHVPGSSYTVTVPAYSDYYVHIYTADSSESATVYADQKVKVNGAYQTVRPKVSKSALNYEAGGTIESALAGKQPVGDYALKSDIASVYKVMGSCTNANLPASPTKGDVWNITDNGTYPAGSNVVWTGSAWDKLSETVDLSGYALKSELPTSVNGMSGGTITSEVTVQGHIRGQYLYSTWLSTSSATALTTAERIAVIQGGWIYYITPANLKTVMGVPTKLSDLTIDKELGNKVTYSETEPSEPKSGDTWFKIED